ncbi:MAG: type II toxin-antitoxin system RelE/ParE family toxin [Proteobacteria bacterium]|nr:type II toxin-antitoxin system RelE/ParE family toxin [Pseudomonadota bacterium]
MIIEFHPKASEELAISAEFYETKVSRLGIKFLNEVERMTQVLEETPMLGIELKTPFRRAVLHRFPFSLIYTAEENTLWFVAVAHHKLKPGYWKVRVDR